MADRFKPADHAEVEQLIAWAVSEEMPLELIGAGTKRGLGRPSQTAHTVDLSALSGVTGYEPNELVLTARAATPMCEIETMLRENGQALAFEPPDYGALLSAPTGTSTLAGVVACNLSGPRRIKSGAVRDHVLAFQAVSGRGETFKSGGRVVKNVTGYDLSKLLTGSHGTLAAMTEVTVKVLPAPESARTVLVTGLSYVRAVEAMSAALNSSHDVSGAAHLPAAAVARSKVTHVSAAGTPVTALRLEGVRPSVVARCDALRHELAPFGAVEELHTQNTIALWAEVRDLALLPPAGNVWRVSVPPKDGANLARQVQSAIGGDVLFDWGGGLLWIVLDPTLSLTDGGSVAIRSAMTAGHATLVRAPETVRAAIDVFQPQSEPVSALTARVKDAFDPHRILNPGRMYAGL